MAFTNYAMSFSIKANYFLIMIYLSIESIILKHKMLRAICINPALSRVDLHKRGKCELGSDESR